MKLYTLFLLLLVLSIQGKVEIHIELSGLKPISIVGQKGD